jgi:O-antigen/teichoic acid export membrane protein
MTEEHKLFVKRIGVVGVAQTFQSMKGLIYLPIFTKILGSSEYGIWSLILTTIAVLQPFILLGLQDAILRFLAPLSKEKIVQGLITVIITVLFTSFIISIIFFFSSDILANIIFKEPSSVYVIQLAIPLIILDTVNMVILGSFRVFGMIKKYAAVLIVKTSLEIVLILFFVLSGFGLFGAMLSLIITEAVSLTIMLFFIFSYAGFAKPDFSLLRPFLIFGLPLIPITLARFVIDSSDRYVIGFYMGAEKVGIYSAAYGIGVIPLVLSTYLVYVLGPTVYNLHDNGLIEKARMYLSYSWKYLLMLSIPSAFGLSILSRPLLLNMTTSKFVPEGLYIIPLVVLCIVFWGMEQIFGISLLIFKRRKIFIIAFLSGAVTNFILNIILVPRYGIIAAAITTLIAYIIITIIIGYSSRRYFTFSLNLQFITKCIFASIGMTVCIWIFNPIDITGIIISIIMGIFVYFCLLFLQKGFRNGEIRSIFEIFGFKKFYEKIVILSDRMKK